MKPFQAVLILFCIPLAGLLYILTLSILDSWNSEGMLWFTLLVVFFLATVVLMMILRLLGVFFLFWLYAENRFKENLRAIVINTVMVGSAVLALGCLSLLFFYFFINLVGISGVAYHLMHVWLIIIVVSTAMFDQEKFGSYFNNICSKQLLSLFFGINFISYLAMYIALRTFFW